MQRLGGGGCRGTLGGAGRCGGGIRYDGRGLCGRAVSDISPEAEFILVPFLSRRGGDRSKECFAVSTCQRGARGNAALPLIRGGNGAFSGQRCGRCAKNCQCGQSDIYGETMLHCLSILRLCKTENSPKCQQGFGERRI